MRAGAVVDNPAPVNLGPLVVDVVVELVPLRNPFSPLLHLLPTSLGKYIVLGFVLPRLFIPPVYLAWVLPVLPHARLDRVWDDGEVEQSLPAGRWVHNDPVLLIPEILAGLLVGFTQPQHLAFIHVCSLLLHEVWALVGCSHDPVGFPLDTSAFVL